MNVIISITLLLLIMLLSDCRAQQSKKNMQSYNSRYTIVPQTKFTVCREIFGWLIKSGERGIRTLGARERTTVFETAPFDHSGISPGTKIMKFGSSGKKGVICFYNHSMHII